MEQWLEYGDGNREEVRSLIGKVKEEYWRRMPEQQRQKVIANLAEKRRIKEEKAKKERALVAAAVGEKKRRATQSLRPRPTAVDKQRRAWKPRWWLWLMAPMQPHEFVVIKWIITVELAVVFALGYVLVCRKTGLKFNHVMTF
uniref:Uncharacterized protein n=1 Tax=Leersia perrieri TaxID=77586 RepID=A0A0D9UYJ8_9ORYZ